MSATQSRQPLQRAQRTRPLPPKLGELLAAINPFVTQGSGSLPSDWTALTDIWKPLPGKSQEKRTSIRLREIAAARARYPSATQHYIGPVTAATLNTAFSQYWLLEYAMRVLITIATVNAEPLTDTFQRDVIEVRFVIDPEKGTLRPSSALLDILAKVDCRRIRQCVRCGKLFWAGRLNKVCCTEECSRVQRVRRYRKTHPEA
jgi:hypothetical protein